MNNDLSDYCPGIIWNSETCREYEHQTGGYACHTQRIKGAIFKIEKHRDFVDSLLLNYFIGSKWSGWCCCGIDEETALVIDAVLSALDVKAKVDRNKLEESEEAFVYIEDENKKGVFFWDNSD